MVDVVFYTAKFLAIVASTNAGQFLIRLGTAALLSVVTSKLFGPKIPDQVANLSGVSVMTRSAIEYRQRVYGQAMVSGPIVYNNVSGDDNEYLWYVIALAEGEIEDLVEIHLDDRVIPKADIDWTAGASGADGSGTGDVSTSVFVGSNSTKAVQAFWALGHANQVAMSKLTDAFSDWGTNHRLRGTAYVVVKMLYNADTEEVWRNGAPQNIRAVIKGSKVYDVRLDSTNGGTGSHRYNDESTWEWSDTPELCLANYLIDVMDVDPATAIDWTSVDDGADHSETTVAIDTASPANTEKRFTCNGVVSYGASHKDNIDTILSSADLKLGYTGGVWSVRASKWEASSVTITEDDIIGPVEVLGSSEYENRKNTIRGVFVDPARNYEAAEFPITSIASYVTRDASKVLTADLELPMTNSATMAQRIADRLLDQFNNQVAFKARVTAIAANLAIGDVCSVTIDKFSWSAKTFRCIEWQRNIDETYEITLREDSSSSYDDPAGSFYTGGNTGGVTYPSDVVPAPTALSAASVAYGVQLAWTNPAANEFDFIDVYESADSSWSNATRVASVRGDKLFVPHASSETYYYWIRARRYSGDVSSRFPDSDTSNISSTSSGDSTPVKLQGAMLNDISTSPTDASVGYQLNSSGKERSYEGSGAAYADIDDWLLEGVNSDYQCRLTVNSGTSPSGSAVGSWLALSTTRSWTLTDSSVVGDPIENNCTIEIADTASPPNVLVSATVTMLAWEASGA